jgi:hypothetical protein
MGASPARMGTGPSTQDTSRNDKPDLGWLGLLGRAGLLGLRRNRDDTHAHTHTDALPGTMR